MSKQNDFKFGEHVLVRDNDNEEWRRAKFIVNDGMGSCNYYVLPDESNDTVYSDQCKHDPYYFRNGEEVEILHPETDEWVIGRFVGYDESNPRKCNHVVEYGSETAYCSKSDIRRPNSIEQKLQSFKDRWDKKFSDMEKQFNELEREIKGEQL